VGRRPIGFDEVNRRDDRFELFVKVWELELDVIADDEVVGTGGAHVVRARPTQLCC
jgi:hypothetical protein